MTRPVPASLMIGQTFGRLRVISEAEFHRGPDGSKYRRWLCECFCGNKVIVPQKGLRKGTTTSCGCWQREVTAAANLKHGHSVGGRKTPEYNSWKHAVERCTNPNCKKWPIYGGRGITICSSWLIFENFLADMGLRPSPKHSIERKDTNGHYCPENCVWATAKEQARNCRTNRLVSYLGETHCLAEWAERFGMNAETLRRRLKAGWTAEKAFTKAPRQLRATKGRER